MKQYAEITDCGECYSTLSLKVKGILANRSQWEKYNFYPQNGNVGEITELDEANIRSFGNEVCILKITDEVYVPMSPNGIKFISKEEYNKKTQNQSLSEGMNNRQKNINNNYDSFLNALFEKK